MNECVNRMCGVNVCRRKRKTIQHRWTVHITTLLHRYCQPPYISALWTNDIELQRHANEFRVFFFSLSKLNTNSTSTYESSTSVLWTFFCLHIFVLFFIGLIIYSLNLLLYVLQFKEMHRPYTKGACQSF